MPKTPGGSGTKTSESKFLSISVGQLKFFNKVWDRDSTSILTIKKTTRARLSSIETIDLGSEKMPYDVLPGSLHPFTLKMDRRKSFVISRRIPKDQSLYQDAPCPPENEYSEPPRPLTYDETIELLTSIRFIQDYLVELYERTVNIEDSEMLYVSVPADLTEALVAIENVFSETLEYSLAELQKSIGKLKEYLESRNGELQSRLKELIEAMSPDAAPQEGPTSWESSFILPYFKREDWSTGNYFSQYKRFLGGQTPTEHNEVMVNNLLENLIFDALIHDPENWLRNRPLHGNKIDYPSLAFRLKGSTEEIRQEYSKISTKLSPVKDALTELKERGIGDLSAIDADLSECSVINKFLNEVEGGSYLSYVTKSPGELTKQIQQIISKHNLASVMEDELKSEFSGIYNKLLELEDQERTRKMDEIYNKLAPIRTTFEHIARKIKEARELIIQKASLRDVANVRESANNDILEFRKEINDLRRDQDRVESLKTDSKNLLTRIEEWLVGLNEKLSGNADKDALLWIGLGQAGGQILRECLTYCLQNLADARCSALLTALGISSKDKKSILYNMKNIHSNSPDEKTDAENNLKTIFDRKAHVLAINLGEEIDKLAKSSQPSFFLWGDDYKTDTTSQTVRSKRNILKLIEDGRGAGGATGIGRAYGFRFHSDISETMRDIGKKNNRHPQHIVITHSLSGGSGSGMVLPVLEQARRTFGREPVIWVISVGEGATEDKGVAKINTPFILSDILQAAYDGIHEIYDPISYANIRQFKSEVKTPLAEMEKFSRELLEILGSELTNEESVYSTLQKILGRNSQRSSEMMNQIISAVEYLNNLNLDSNLTGIGKMRPMSTERKIFISSHRSSRVFDQISEILPKGSDDATSFSEWCEEQKRDGSRPAGEFWKNWRIAILDPLSIHLRGRERGAMTKSDDGENNEDQHFEPDLTGDQLKQIVLKLYSENNIQRHGKDVPPTAIKQGLDSLYDYLNDFVSKLNNYDEREGFVNSIETCLNEYARNLDTYNNAIIRLDRHIQSLTGSGNDTGIKSIVVSNAHLENGVSQTGKIKVSSEAYTVFNSVIFDLMLNIIGPRLPTEPGVYINTDAEEYDHNDMLGSTKPPMVVGLLNQRDSASLSEPIKVGRHQDEKIQYPPDFNDLLNSILTSEFVSDSQNNGLRNPAFVAYEEINPKYQELFTAIFGSRYKYILETDPYQSIDLSNEISSVVEEFTSRLIQHWDESEHVVFGLVKTQRDSLAANHGVSGLHIGNFIRWIGLIPISEFALFISAKGDEKRIADELSKDGSIWKTMEHLDAKFDIDMLTKASSLQFYRQKAKVPNTKLLYALFPKMGLFNAQSLRTVGPAYINSFLPLVMLKSKEVLESYNKIELKIPHDHPHIKTRESLIEFISDTFDYMQEDHSFDLGGLLATGEDAEFYKENLRDINQFLDYVDLRLKVEEVGEETSVFLEIHPRLERYLSVIRDIPPEPEHQYLPARSTPASMARYLYSDGDEQLLDMTSNSKLRTGIAAPNFIMGLDLLKQFRFANLLPDELRLSLPTTMRILLLTPDSSKEAIQRLGKQFDSIGFNLEEITPYLEDILDNEVFLPMKSYNVPEDYCEFIKTVVLRMHKLKPLVDYLLTHRPKNWTANDEAGLEYLQESVFSNEEIMYNNPSDVIEELGRDKASTPNLKQWFQDVINDVVKDLSNMIEEQSEEGEGELVVSNQNPTVIKIKQFFYDLVSTTSEAYHQAEYFQDDGKDSRNVHFEMTGFSDRLLGQPSGLLLMMHDRNVNLPMNIIKQNARSSLSHFLSDFANPKEFSTASDFGPTSFMTMVFTQAPAADIADQFQQLMINPQNGLGGDSPDWPIWESKLHPYMLLYNLVWLSVSVIGKWSMRSNRVYSRRFQIPLRVIEHHFQNPEELYENKKTIEQNKRDFPGEITMPLSDNRAYANALKKKDPAFKNRNLVRLMGLMALRYEHICVKAKNIDAKKDDADKELWAGKDMLTKEQYDELRGCFTSSQINVDWEHLMAPEKENVVTNQKLERRKKWARSPPKDNLSTAKPDTAEDRARAWFKAYANWINYQPPEEIDSSSVSEANLFTVGDSVPNLRPDTSPQTVPEVSETPEPPSTPELPHEENVDFSEDS